MEKAMQNSDSPVGVLEDYLRCIETDTNSSTESQKNPKTTSRWHSFVELFRSKSKKQLSAFAPVVPKLSGWRSSSMREKVPVSMAGDHFANAAGLPGIDSPCRDFTLSELQLATKNFSKENLIGKGGYAEVYKGRLQDGQIVAVKRLTRGTPEERIADFLSELGIMAHVNHPNAITLIGYGVEGGMYLVLEYSYLGSLASLLHGGSKEKLIWSIRYKIALGIAEGLIYLHYGCQRRIIHRDIKAANILLKKDFEPQICDFGLAKWLPDKWTHHIVLKFEGTFGYLAPEYLMHGIVDEKTDVFAFGVLLLELITGRRALDCSQQSLVMWAKPLLRKNNVRELVDPALVNSFNPKQMNLMLLGAGLCVQRSSIRRPQMNQVLQLLKGNLRSLESLKKHGKPSFWKMYYDEIIDAEDDAPVKLSR
uniref:non-specific serine/threonine protein kinase n=1 Tax=Opuntia streptacantha TaxID=393608 RepID=A0A7C9DLS0_OPUST